MGEPINGNPKIGLHVVPQACRIRLSQAGADQRLIGEYEARFGAAQVKDHRRVALVGAIGDVETRIAVMRAAAQAGSWMSICPELGD
ncbi:hypothetical protein [Mycobacterium leprae]|uniref:hypothetical protein n=1 Tax=Mycobacterium leprae TaxID=1769 RepID=UPI000AEDD6EC|nr:hypothetical protein [Mycobacterium leprae]